MCALPQDRGWFTRGYTLRGNWLSPLNSFRYPIASQYGFFPRSCFDFSAVPKPILWLSSQILLTRKKKLNGTKRNCRIQSILTSGEEMFCLLPPRTPLKGISLNIPPNPTPPLLISSLRQFRALLEIWDTHGNCQTFQTEAPSAPGQEWRLNTQCLVQSGSIKGILVE